MIHVPNIFAVLICSAGAVYAYNVDQMGICLLQIFLAFFNLMFIVKVIR